MIEQKVIEYIIKAKSVGQTEDQIKSALSSAGWTAEEILENFKAVASQRQPIQQPKPIIQPAQPSQAQREAAQPVQSVQQPRPAQQSQPVQPAQQQPKPFAPPVQPIQIRQEPAPYTAQTYTAQTNEKIQKKPKRFVGILVSLIAVILIFSAVGAGVALVTRAWDPLWNPFRPSPESVVANMLANMKGAKSYRTLIRGEINATDSASGAVKGKLTFNIDGESDTADAQNPKANFTFAINLTTKDGASPLFSANTNMIAVNNVLYFKVNDLIISDAPISETDISKIKGKWLEVDQSSMKTLFDASGASAQVPQINLQQNNQELGKMIMELISAENMLSIDKQLDDQVVNSQDTYHYLATISKEKLKDLIGKIIDLQIQATLDANPSLSSQNNNIEKTLAGSFIDTIGDLNIEMWIGKKDYMLYASKFEKNIDFNKISPGANMQVAIKFNIDNSNFGKTISLQEPEGALRAEKVVLPLIREQKIKTDISQALFSAQAICSLNKSCHLVCSGGALNEYQRTQGAILKNLNKDIIAQGVNKPICFSNVQGFCFSVQLLDGTWLCASKNGTIGKTKCLSAATICQ